MAERENRTESDVPVDEQTAHSRETGGLPDPRPDDQHSTTGTTPNETFVGRVAGTDAGAAGEQGAEARAAAERAATEERAAGTPEGTEG